MKYDKIYLIKKEGNIMVNKDFRLTVDDLIVHYLAEKTKQGYEPKVTEEEFMNFLNYFTQKKEVDDILWSYDKLINRFIERKMKHDWFGKSSVEFTKDNTLKPNYKFSVYDESVVNTYFMSKKAREEIIDIITTYLANHPKRTLISSHLKDSQIPEQCKAGSALVMTELWDSHIESQKEWGRWPIQCNNIIKYLIEEDLANKIELESIREKLLHFYKIFAQKSTILLQQDPELRLGNSSNKFLTYSNYQLIIKELQKEGLEEELGNLLIEPLTSKVIEINYQKQKITITGRYESVSNDLDMWEHWNIRQKSTSLNNNQVKKLVKAIEKARN